MTDNPGELRQIWIDIKKKHPNILASETKLGPELDAFEAAWRSYISKLIECGAELNVAAQHAKKLEFALTGIHENIVSDPAFKEFASVVGRLPGLISGYQKALTGLR